MTYQAGDNSSEETLVELKESELSFLNVEELGRRRPDAFSSIWVEGAFITSVLVSLAMAEFIMGGFQVMLPALLEPLDIPHDSQTWPASVLTLVAGATLFPLGRLADMIGGYAVFNGGLAWFTLWTLVAGFSKNYIMLVICRAMEGFGAAAYLTAGISILGSTYRPGPRKNLVFALYGALAPMGFFSGIIIGGMAQDVLSWQLYFWIGSFISLVCNIGGLLTAPRDYTIARRRKVKMDWWGLGTTFPGLILVVYAITDSSHAPQGWASPQIVTTLLLGLCFLAAAVYVEGWVAAAPLIPLDIFQVKYMKRMLACLFLTWGVFATYLFYANFYIQQVLHKSALLTALWFAPWAASGLILAVISGVILHILPGQVLLLMATVSKLLAVLLFALIPENPNYWAWVMPAMVAEAACVDVIYIVSNVFLTTCLPRHRQGLAGALINITVFLGGAVSLAITDVAIDRFKIAGFNLKNQYKGVFWIGVGLAGLALVISCCIRLDKAKSSLTVDEKAKITVSSNQPQLSSPKLIDREEREAEQASTTLPPSKDRSNPRVGGY